MPEGFVEERRGTVRLLIRAGLEDALLSAGIEDPRALATGAIRTFRGRGRPALVEIPREGEVSLRLVVREYRHGGCLARITGGRFVRGDRAREELLALEAARRAGIDTARPVAAIRIERGLGYHAWLATEEVADAADLVAWLSGGEPATVTVRRVLEGLGRAVRRLHDAGIDVPDLHVKNVLVREADPTRPVLLDFDRARVHDGEVPRATRLRDLFRLDRSLEKFARRGTSIARGERARLFRGYLAGDRIPPRERGAVCRRYRLHLALHRLVWRLGGR